MAAPSEACFNAANNAAGGKLSSDEVNAAFDRVEELKRRLIAEGKVDNMSERLREAVARDAEKAKIAAALQRKHAALNIIARDKLDAAIKSHLDAGLDHRHAVLAVMEGTQQGIESGRVSVASKKLAYDGRFVGGMMADVAREVPHALALIDDHEFGKDIVREMWELRDGGKPGSTGNADAQKVAKIFATHAEVARTDLNKLGASIGKLDGWAGPQVHDNFNLLKAGESRWMQAIIPKLDLQRSFPDMTREEITNTLSEIYTTVVTGQDREISAAQKGQYVGPANLAKKLGASRVLHFAGPDEYMAYNAEFGHGGIIPSMISHQKRMAKIAGQMDVFGPNPEVMLKSILAKMQKDIRNDESMSHEARAKAIESLNYKGGIKSAYEIMSGIATSPEHLTAAKVGVAVRSVQSMAKLGGAVITAGTTDTAAVAAATMFRGGGFLHGLMTQISGIMKGRPKGEQREIAFLLNQGYEGLIGHVLSEHANAHDAHIGAISKATETFFKWSGMTWWDDVGRSVNARVIASEMAMRAEKAYAGLPARYRHVLTVQGITEAKWNAIRSGGVRAAENGEHYITPDLMRGLSDDVVRPLVADRIAALKGKPEVVAARTADLLDGMRHELELDLHRFVADEGMYGMLQTDAATRRLTTGSTRPGTLAGELVRTIMQFKGFPIAFGERILGRAIYGGDGATKAQRFINNLPHMGALLAGLTAAGYMAIVTKDTLRGKWPPQNPADPKVLLAALQQSGSAGIWGDYLFGQVSRFGNSPLETAAGPTLGSLSQLAGILQKARDVTLGEGKSNLKAEGVNWMLQNTPFINMWYTRAALDVLFLNSVREWASPGYMARQNNTMRTTTGQHYFLPRTAHELGR